MSAGVSRYAVEMRVSRDGRERRIVMRVEHAYSVMDALIQANLNHAAENPGETCEALVHIGPPADAIAAPTVQIRIDGEQVESVFRKTRTGHAVLDASDLRARG